MSLVPQLSYRNFPMRSSDQLTLKGFFCILWLMLCFVAEQNGGGKALASLLPRECYEVASKVTFDPDTAHSSLVVSEDRKTVTSDGVDHDVPPNPKRFIYWPVVLGTPGIKKGKLCWLVEYGNVQEWSVEVFPKSVKRNRPMRPVIEHEFPEGTGTIGIFLNCDEKTVIYYRDDVVEKNNVDCSRVEMVPFFYVGRGASLRLIDLTD